MSEQTAEKRSLSLQLFGAMTVHCGGDQIASVRSRKALSLLALLALHANRAQSRDWLAATVWPDSATPRETLRRTLTDLRAALGPCGAALEAEHQTLCLRVPEREVDVLWFNTLRKREDLAAWDEAIALYRGPLLEGFREPWLDAEQMRYAEAYVDLLERAAAAHEARNTLSTAIACLRAAVKAAPFQESLHRRLMQTLVKTGMPDEAVRVYQDLRQFLQQTTGAEPDPETLALYRQVRQDILRAPVTAPAPVADSESAGPLLPPHLPRPLTRLIGREEELAEVTERLTRSRLVTITGMGGVGKTRLSIEAATALRDRFPDDAWFVDLAALSDPALLPRTVAHALNIAEESGRDILSSLTDRLRSGHFLVVLDNCEHVLTSCASLVRSLLPDCPKLSVLATSREALRIPGEWVFRLTPLPIQEMPTPDWVENASVPSPVEPFPALRLFVERASATRSDFSPTPPVLRAATTICRRLEGIPLALELAAARTRSLSTEQIAERLEDRFRLLRGGNRAAPERQQSLRALIDWSYDLLSPDERRLFARLSVFAGGWTLEAAAEICGDIRGTEFPAAGTDTWEILDLLDSLVEKSLVLTVEQPDGETRYRMLETLREYARDRLADLGETALVRQRHHVWFLKFAESAERVMGGPDQTAALHQIEREQDNLRLAIRGMESVTDRLRLASSLFWHWYVHGHYGEGRAALETDLNRTDSLPVPLRCKSLKALGDLCWAQGDMDAARAAHRENLELHEREQNIRGLAITWNSLGLVDYHQGNCVGAAENYRKSLAIFRTLDEPTLTGSLLSNLAMVLKDLGDYTEAATLLTEAESIFRRINNRHRLGMTLHTLGLLAKRRGDYEQARRYVEEAGEVDREVNDVKGQATVQHALGEISLEEGNLDRAERHFQTALEQFDHLGARRFSAASHLSLGEVARARGDWVRMEHCLRESMRIQSSLKDRLGVAYILCSAAFLKRGVGQVEDAVCLLAATHAELERLHAILEPRHAREYEGTRAILRESLGMEPFERLWVEGSGLSMEEAIARSSLG